MKSRRIVMFLYGKGGVAKRTWHAPHRIVCVSSIWQCAGTREAGACKTL